MQLVDDIPPGVLYLYECPFCAGKEVGLLTVENDRGEAGLCVKCTDCLARGPHIPGVNPAAGHKATAEWGRQHVTRRVVRIIRA